MYNLYGFPYTAAEITKCSTTQELSNQTPSTQLLAGKEKETGDSNEVKRKLIQEELTIQEF